MSEMNADIGSVAPAVEAPTTETPGLTTDAAPDDLPEVPADQAVFDRAYVQQLRDAAAKYRLELRETQGKLSSFDDVFGVYEADDVSTWLDLARTYAADPTAAAQMMRDISAAILAEGGTQEQAQAAAEAVAEASEGSDRPLTAEDVQRLVQERLDAIEAERAQQEAIQNVWKTVEELGFKPDSMQGVMLMWIANNQTDGDLNAAKAVMDAHNQSIIDSYLQTKQPGYRVAASPVSTAATHAVDSIKDVQDGSRRAQAYLDEVFGRR